MYTPRAIFIIRRCVYRETIMNEKYRCQNVRILSLTFFARKIDVAVSES